ncbi:maltokinase N-terminal cap-like domain-containing protein [Actinomadura barringtoniae]|uniref:maltokinase N-terminal cap-like domain-containing protein n=1 Tax=Actinomadura barringtoniae TaxID=1427535 RepID=UPI0027DC5F9F|nr:phosphotransferase [Actinomadura barringtoniae]
MLPPEPVLTGLLAGWLPRQRWFAGKDREISGVSVVTATELRPALHHLVLAVEQGPVVDHYQLVIGSSRDIPERLRPGEIGLVPGSVLYDAAHDPEANALLLSRMADETHIGSLRFRHTPGVAIDTGLDSALIAGEQSNTSVIFADSYICKLFRRLSPGVNPDLEVNLALSGSEHTPAVIGWMETDSGDTLALLSEYLRTGTDGWKLAVTSARDWLCDVGSDPATAGGDFAAESERLGAATAAVHRDLAEAFGVTTQPRADLLTMVERMRAQLSEVCNEVPDLRPQAEAIASAFDDLAAMPSPLTVQRVHGDYHLGQVMRTDTGWVLLDFEGEPARTPTERKDLAHPLRDVAGMLRSFEYAARFMEAENGLESRAYAWAARNRDAFCKGYASAGGPDPAEHASLIRAFEFDKAVYEVRYEARNRPSWLHVPLRSLSHLAA